MDNSQHITEYYSSKVNCSRASQPRRLLNVLQIIEQPEGNYDNQEDTEAIGTTVLMDPVRKHFKGIVLKFVDYDTWVNDEGKAKKFWIPKHFEISAEGNDLQDAGNNSEGYGMTFVLSGLMAFVKLVGLLVRW